MFLRTLIITVVTVCPVSLRGAPAVSDLNPAPFEHFENKKNKKMFSSGLRNKKAMTSDERCSGNNKTDVVEH